MQIGIGVTLLAALLGGCGGGDADSVFVDVSWSFRSVSANAPQMCPDTFTKVELHVEGVSVTTPDCAPGSGRSDAVPKGEYDVFLTVVNADGTQTWATSTPARLDLTLGDRSFSRQFLVDGGVFHAGWKLVDDAGAEIDCTAADVAGIVIAATDEANPDNAQTDEVDCEEGAGYSFGYAAGSYGVTLEAIDASGVPRGMTAPLTGQVITAPNGITDLGVIEITIPGL